MSWSSERMFTVRAQPQKILPRALHRYSWDITNIGAATIYYMRGPRGRDVGVAGESQGVPIAANAADGYDEQDAVDEVWVVAAANVNVIVHTTMMAAPKEGNSGPSRRQPSAHRRH